MEQSPGVKHSKPNKWFIGRLVTVIVVKWPLRKLMVPLSILAMLIATQAAEAGSFMDFFSAPRPSITHPEQNPRSHRGSRTQNKDAVPSECAGHGSTRVEGTGRA